MVPWVTCTFTVAEYDHVYMNSTDLYFTRVSPANNQVHTSKYLIKRTNSGTDYTSYTPVITTLFDCLI